MKRPLIIGLVLAGAAVAALPAVGLSLVSGFGRFDATASAAGGAPPAPPMVLYGAVPGIPGTTGVTVMNNGTGANCGSGKVISDGGATYYVVDVYSDSQVAGCGTNGSSMSLSLYFSPSTAGTGGRVATVSVTWATGAAQQNASPGSPLPIAAYAPVVARDGVQ